MNSLWVLYEVAIYVYIYIRCIHSIMVVRRGSRKGQGESGSICYSIDLDA